MYLKINNKFGYNIGSNNSSTTTIQNNKKNYKSYPLIVIQLLITNACIQNRIFKIYSSLSFLLSCKGICSRYDKTGGGKQSAYSLGYKRCSECDLYIRFDGSRCPCCHYPLRSKRRNN